MLRTIPLALALLAFAGAAAADCSSAHNAKETLTNDEQANASQVPPVAKASVPASKKPVQVAKKQVSDKDKESSDKVLAVNKPVD